MDQNIFSSQSLLQAVQQDRHAEVVARLNAREDVNKKFTMGRTALHAAAGKDNNKSVSILLEDRRINIEVSDSFGNRALHLASSRDRASASVSVVEELVKAGAMLDCQDKAGRTPLMKAVMAGNMAVARLLLESGACRDLGIDRKDCVGPGMPSWDNRNDRNSIFDGKKRTENRRS